MSWVRIDDQMPNKAKVRHVGPLGLALHVSAICYAARDLTDGFVPDAVVPSLLDLPKKQLSALLPLMASPAPRQQHPLWHQVEGGYEIHDYLEYNPNRAQVLGEREAAKQRMFTARSGKVQANNGGSSGNPDPLPRPQPDPLPPPSPLLLAARAVWTNKVGVVPPGSRDEFSDYAERAPAEWFEQAVTVTVREARRPNWKFCKAVLDRAFDEGRPPDVEVSKPYPTSLNEILQARKRRR